MKLRAHPYRLPFRKPLITSSKTYNHRSGLLLMLLVGRKSFYGEAAPLPGFSSETVEEIKKTVENNGQQWKEMLQREKPTKLLEAYYLKTHIPPSLQFALDSLAYQLEAHRTDQSLLSHLFNIYSPQISVNAVISLSNKATIIEQETDQLIKKGYNTLKCKVGLNAHYELSQLHKLRANYPRLNIRLDANGAWTPEEAKNYLKEVETIGIEYCEEPLANPTADAYALLQAQTKSPLALDESLTKANHIEALLSYCSVLILKPMVLGSFRTLFDICKRANKLNIKIVLTTSLESGIGRNITAALATGIGSFSYAHGLNTAGLLGRDLLPEKPKISNGFISTDKLFPITKDNLK